MNNSLTINEINKVYKILRSDIDKYVLKGQYEKAYALLDSYAIICQGINDHFRDDHIEKVLKNISYNVFGSIACPLSPIGPTNIVFYDQIGTTVCLGLQYMRALKDLGYNITYIFESPIRRVQESFLSEVKHTCSSYHIFEGPSTLEKAKTIQSLILQSGSSKIITHFSAEGALAASVLYSLGGMERYRIVPGDHHYYLGIDCYDHYLDYRDFAVKVSVEERMIPMQKINRLTYYPIIDSSVSFKGFPKEVEGKIIILAAGAEYKFHGSNWFFDFSKWLLDNHDGVVIVFLGDVSSKIKNFVDENHFEEKFLLLGYRNDFVECMKHSDIFLNSYPMGGGLVGLTAVNLAIPVLSHYDEFNGLQNSIRSFMGAEKINSPISFSDDSEMKKYASRLICDNDFRREEGKRMKSMTQTRDKFTTQLGEILKNNAYQVTCVTEKSCHLEKRLESYITLQNDFQPSILLRLARSYGFSYIFHFPFLLCYSWNHRKMMSGFIMGLWANKIFPSNLFMWLKKKLMSKFI